MKFLNLFIISQKLPEERILEIWRLSESEHFVKVQMKVNCGQSRPLRHFDRMVYISTKITIAPFNTGI
jgi:hypothetical protein